MAEKSLSPKSIKVIPYMNSPFKITNDENIINEIIDIDDYIKKIPEDELLSKIQEFKDIKDSKLNQLSKEENILNKYENKNHNRNNDYNNYLSKTQIFNDENINKKMNFFKTENDNMNQFVESTLLSREHEKNLSDLKEEYKNKLNKELENIENTFQKERKEIIEEHRNKVKSYEDKILKLKMEIDEIENNNENIIKKEEYDNLILSKLGDYMTKLQKNTEEIEKLEKKIEQNYPKLINHEEAPYNIDLSNENLSDKLLSNEIDDLIKELNQTKKKNGLLFMISKLKKKEIEKEKERQSKKSNSNYIIKTDGSEQDYDCDTNENDDNIVRDIPSLDYEPLKKKIQFFRTHQDFN